MNKKEIAEPLRRIKKVGADELTPDLHEPPSTNRGTLRDRDEAIRFIREHGLGEPERGVFPLDHYDHDGKPR